MHANEFDFSTWLRTDNFAREIKGDSKFIRLHIWSNLEEICFTAETFRRTIVEFEEEGSDWTVFR